MPIYYPDILQQRTDPRRFAYGDKDVMLYAVSIGLGRDPLNEKELPFVYESGLKVMPTAVTVLAAAGGGSQAVLGEAEANPPGLRISELNYLAVLHGEQKVEIHKPLPTAGAFTAHMRTVGAFDKGKDKGAVLVQETRWLDTAGETAVTITTTMFARGDGGFGGPMEGAPVPHPRPTRPPDLSIDMDTTPGQALLYRLNGDRNPVHADLGIARMAGFERPILHGLCTYGITCRAVLQHCLDYEAERVLSHQARFSSPVFPGETVTVDIWRDGPELSFEARVKARDVTVIRNGLTVVR